MTSPIFGRLNKRSPFRCIVCKVDLKDLSPSLKIERIYLVFWRNAEERAKSKNASQREQFLVMMQRNQRNGDWAILCSFGNETYIETWQWEKLEKKKKHAIGTGKSWKIIKNHQDLLRNFIHPMVFTGFVLSPPKWPLSGAPKLSLPWKTAKLKTWGVWNWVEKNSSYEKFKAKCYQLGIHMPHPSSTHAGLHVSTMTSVYNTL